MPTSPVETVKEAYDSFAKGDIPTVLNLIDPNAEWVESEAVGIPTRGTPIGPAAVAEKVFGTISRDWTEFTLVPEKFICEGEEVVVEGHVKATAKTTGRSMGAPFVHVFTVREGKVGRLTNHHDTALWLQTLGE
ncbi:MAG TPA: nuclear transport factor 2 family protein [Acidimicrobiales bacterium]|jgi:hypothetical protein